MTKKNPVCIACKHVATTHYGGVLVVGPPDGKGCLVEKCECKGFLREYPEPKTRRR